MNPQIVTLAWDGAEDSRPVHIFIDQALPEFATAEAAAEFYVSQAQALCAALYMALAPATLAALTCELLLGVAQAIALPGQIEEATDD